MRNLAMHSFGSNIRSFQLNRPSGDQRDSIAIISKRKFNGSHLGALTLNRKRNPSFVHHDFAASNPRLNSPSANSVSSRLKSGSADMRFSTV